MMNRIINAGIQRRTRSVQEFPTVCDRHSTSESPQEKEKHEAGEAYFAQIQTLRQGLERNLFRFPRPCRFVIWRITLARQFAVCEPMPSNLSHQHSQAVSIGQFAVAFLPIVVAEHLLINVAREMKWLYSDIGSLKAPLKQRPEVFHAVCVNATANVSLGLVNNIVNESALQSTFIAHCAIGVNRAPELHVAENFVLQRFAGYVWHDGSANLAKIAVKNALHDGLVPGRPKTIGSQAATFVHVLGDSADKGFVCFQFIAFTADLRALAELFALHDFADALQHKPCRRLRNFNRARQLVATNSVLAVRQHPEGDHPLVEGDRGIFHDGLDLDRKLLLAGVAKPDAASLDERVLGCRTARADNLTIRPAQLDRIGKTAVWIGKVHNRFLQRFRLLEGSVHKQYYTASAHVCQLVYCRIYALQIKYIRFLPGVKAI